MLIVDIGVIVAAADRADPAHPRSRELITQSAGNLPTTGMVIAEAAYLIERELGPEVEALLYDSISIGGIVIEQLVHTDWIRIAQLVRSYDNLPLGGTDASLIAIAERLGGTQIATLDHRHFSVVRPAHAESFELLS